MSPIITLAGWETEGIRQGQVNFIPTHGNRALEYDDLSRPSGTDLPYAGVPQINRNLPKNIRTGQGSRRTYRTY